MAEQQLPRFFLALMVLATFLLALVIKPVVTELLLAAILAGVLWPLQRRLWAFWRSLVGLVRWIRGLPLKSPDWRPQFFLRE